MKVFAALNQKGGAGKTTLAVNLCAALAGDGRRVLLVDADPQGNATSGVGADKTALTASIYEVILGDKGILEAAIAAPSVAGLSLVGANISAAGAEIELPRADDWQTRLKTQIDAARAEFDFTIIDCPPSLGVFSVNALVAADAVLIPMQCEYFALEGLSDLADTVRRLRADLNPRLRIAAIARVIVDSRNTLAREISRELERHFGDAVFETEIPRNVRVAESASHGLPVILYAPESKGARAYRQLAREFLRKFDS